MTSTSTHPRTAPPGAVPARPDPFGGPEPAKALRTTVRDVLRDLIVTGEIGRGARLVERTLAERLGVSRVPVREALRDLVAEGYAVTRATGGISVRDYPAAEVAELFEIRGALESILLRRATGGLSPEGIRRLRACLDATGAALADGDRAGAVAGNARFHEVLADVAAGPLLRGLLDGIRDRMRWLLRQHGDPAAMHAEHVALLGALVAGDEPTVERLAAQHLATSRAEAAGRPAGPGR